VINQFNHRKKMFMGDTTESISGTDLKIKLVDKAAMDLSGAVAQGLSAINTQARGRKNAYPWGSFLFVTNRLQTGLEHRKYSL